MVGGDNRVRVLPAIVFEVEMNNDILARALYDHLKKKYPHVIFESLTCDIIQPDEDEPLRIFCQGLQTQHEVDSVQAVIRTFLNLVI